MPDRTSPSPPHARQGFLIWAGGFAPLGGIETFLADLAQSAAERGAAVELFGWDRRSKLLRGLREAGVHLSVSAWRWGCHWHLPDWLTLPLGLWKCRSARAVLFGKTLPPVMHHLIRHFGRRPGREQRFVYMTPYRPAEIFTRPEERSVVQAMLNTFDLIITQNSVFAAELCALGYTGPIEILPYLPPPAAKAPASYPTGALTIGFLGRLEHQKNLPALLRAFAALRREEDVPGAQPSILRLRLFGEGSQRATLTDLARQLGLGASVEFRGAIGREEVAQAIRSCHVFCFTSHTEGQPLAALEILAQGRPIVATAIGAFPDMLVQSEFGAVVPPGDEAAFLSALKDVLARQKNGHLSPAGTVRAYRENFDRDEVLSRYLQLLSPETLPAPRDLHMTRPQPASGPI